MGALPDWYFALVLFLFGLAVGSFVNVVVYRLPHGLSIATPRSACPHCGRELTWYDNIPLFSYFALAGRCRHCRERISLRYPLIEVVVAILWLLLTIRLGLVADLPAFLTMAAVLVALSAIDIEHRRLPNRILGPAVIVALALFVLAAEVNGEWSRFLRGLIGALAYGAPIFLVAIIVPKGMGGGDIKLAAYLGLHLGWIGMAHVAVGAILGFFTGSIAGVALIAAGKKGRKDPIPFGPFMALGSLLAVFFGDRIVGIWVGYH